MVIILMIQKSFMGVELRLCKCIQKAHLKVSFHKDAINYPKVFLEHFLAK